ncbi:MAG: phosphoribosylamine--glycine ligase, partial [Chloroflexi bacterium]|nr:phosphoribosylamine--glycine ligase [Chloroflexota bacterium]
NCRFGDPEAQVILPLLETDLHAVLDACIEGDLDQIELQWANKSCVCVVMASQGYPGAYKTGYEIQGLDRVAELPDTVVFHAGTKRQDGKIVTAGGRVLGVTAWADDLAGAIERAYAAVERIHWPGAMYRRDIGAKGLRLTAEISR